MAGTTRHATPSTQPDADTAQGANTDGTPPVNTAKVPDPRPEPATPPAFLSEGTAQELILTGAATDPRTGAQLDRGALPSDRISTLSGPENDAAPPAPPATPES